MLKVLVDIFISLVCCKFTCEFVVLIDIKRYNIKKKRWEELTMPNIKPISDLRNYTAVLNEVTYGNRVYLTRNGHGQCAIIDMKELDELDKMKALNKLMSKLNEAENSIREHGTISADDLEAELGV